jgi:hypothetical protein
MLPWLGGELVNEGGSSGRGCCILHWRRDAVSACSIFAYSTAVWHWEQAEREACCFCCTGFEGNFGFSLSLASEQSAKAADDGMNGYAADAMQ